MRIGIDVGGSHIGIGAVDSKGKLCFKKEKDYNIKCKDMSKVVIETINEMLDEIINTEKIRLESVESIGIAFPGTVSNGTVIKVDNLGIENLNIVKELENHINIPINLKNDAKCAAIAEKEYGSLKPYDDALFLIIGTGVGGAAFLGGKLLKPKRYSGLEVGHMVIKKNGIQCNCGRYGCFEVYASMKRLKEKINREFRLDTIDGIKIREFIENNTNNKKLEEMLNTYIEDLTIGIANLVNIFEPEAISIGGSFAYYKEILLPRLQKELLEKRELYNKEKLPKLVIAELRNDAGIIGAAMI